MDPRVDGRVHHFSCAGLYKGTAIQTDEETGTLWDHITGRALHGALAGKKLKVCMTPAALANLRPCSGSMINTDN